LGSATVRRRSSTTAGHEFLRDHLRHAELRENAKPEAGFKLKPALDQGRCRRWIAVSTLWSNGGLEAVCHCREDFTSTIIALTIGRLSQDLRGDAIRTQSSLINGPR
jgi:hypothetical protein